MPALRRRGRLLGYLPYFLLRNTYEGTILVLPEHPPHLLVLCLEMEHKLSRLWLREEREGVI